MKFNLVTLRVENMEKSLLFYREILQLPLIARFTNKENQKIVMLGEEELPNIELVETKKREQPGAGISIGFEVENAKKTIQKIKENFSCDPVGPISPNPHLRFFFVEDPDGNTVQLMEGENG